MSNFKIINVKTCYCKWWIYIWFVLYSKMAKKKKY